MLFVPIAYLSGYRPGATRGKRRKEIAYEEKKQTMDDLMSYIVNLLTLCVNGEDPDTAEPRANDGGGCTGSCSSCGGCG